MQLEGPFSHARKGLFCFHSNRVLTASSQTLGIESRIRWHIGRETFSTEFVRGGGNITVLQKLMDYAKISTTMKYVHVDADMKRAAIAQFDALEEDQL